MRDIEGGQICTWCHKRIAEGDDHCSEDCHDDEAAYWAGEDEM